MVKMVSDGGGDPGAWLAAGGSMGSLVRMHDWSRTPLRSLETWPPGLRTMVGTTLTGRHPTILAWGSELTCIHNDAFRSLLDPASATLGRPFLDLWPEARDILAPLVEKAGAGEAGYIESVPLPLTRNGGPEEVCFGFELAPVLDENGFVAGILSTITVPAGQTRQTEDDGGLRKSERRLSTIFTIATVGLSEIAQDGRFVQVNEEICRILGRPREEVLELRIPDVTHPDDIASSFAAIGRTIDTGRPSSLDKRYQRPDGTSVWANSTVTLLEDTSGAEGRFLVVTVDLTVQRQAEAALRESEARFRTLAQTMPQLVWTAVGEGRWTWASARWAEFTGQLPDEWLDWGWLDAVHPDDRDLARQAWREASVAGELDVNLRLRRWDGSWRWFQVMALPVPGTSKVGQQDWCGAFTDVSDLKDVEALLRTARDEAEAASREKSRFLASVSHDLRQPVQAANLFLGVLSQRPLGSMENTLVNSLADSLTSLTGMLTGLLEVARLDAGLLKAEIQVFDIDVLLQRLYSEFQGVARQAKLRLHMPSARWPVRSDPLLVELALRNLISNAIKFTEFGHVCVETRIQDGLLAVDVVDTGRGIAPENTGRIFEEYYQIGDAARDHSRGFGIGLATVRRVAALLGTRVMIQSELGKGSTFTLELPLAVMPGVSDTGVTDSKTVLAGRTVLVVDDEPMVLNALEMTLQAWGMQVHAARTLKQAQAILEGFEQAPDFLIADYSLGPGEYGTAVIAAAKRRGTPVTLLITGDTAKERLVEAKSNSTLMLHKPVNPNQLKSLLIEAFAAR